MNIAGLWPEYGTYYENKKRKNRKQSRRNNTNLRIERHNCTDLLR